MYEVSKCRPTLLSSINNKETFFWLDARFPSNYGGVDTEDNKAPILDELKILSKKPNINSDVIVCDDMRTIKDSKNITYQDSIHENFKITIFTISNLVDVFKKTHYPTLADNGDGLLIFTPKKY